MKYAILAATMFAATASGPAHALTITIPAEAGVPFSPFASSCVTHLSQGGANNGVRPASYDACALVFALPLTTGQNLESIKYHYYDSSGQKGFHAQVFEKDFTELEDLMIDDYFDEGFVRPLLPKGVSITRTINRRVGSERPMYVFVLLTEDTTLRGITITYE